MTASRTATPYPLHFAEVAVLCGAGISAERPSSLPTGGDLALQVFDLTTGGKTGPFAAGPIARLRRQIRTGALRLEVICDLLTREIDPLTVVSPFGQLRGALPNRLHVALTLLAPAALITTNQDLLLERAGEVLGLTNQVVHLHGRCDRPRSIVTTVAGYLHGFTPHKERLLARLLEGRDVLVLGYSGRDLDVMTSLLKANPRRVLWIEHGALQKPAELPTELRLAEQHFGRRWTRIGLKTGDWLDSLLSDSQRDQVKTALAGLHTTHKQATLQARQNQRLSRRFEALDDATRQLAISHVLRHAGLQREAQRGLTRLRRRHRSDGRVALAWAEASFELDDFAEAISAFRHVRNNGADPCVRAQAVLGEVEALRNVSRFEDARTTLDHLAQIAPAIADPAARARIIAAGKCQLGGIARMGGALDAAEAAYGDAEVASAFTGDVRGVLESRTWRTEILLARGRYRAALIDSTSTLDYAPFTNARWLTWARFVHGEALCAAGEVAEGLDVFRETLDEFARYGNPMGEAWSLMAEASFLRGSDTAGAGYALGAAGEAADRYGSPLAYARARLLWEEAELERARRDIAAARKRLRLYRDHMNRWFPRGHNWLKAHGDALEVELVRERGGRAAAALADQARDQYALLGADGAVRRMTVSAWAATAAAPVTRPPRLTRDWKRDGQLLELMALRRAQRGEYTPLQIWFVP